MKRHPALQDYSRDHHFLLLQARAIRWHFEGSRHAAPWEEVLAGFLDAWEHEIAPHLREEEAVLWPLLLPHAPSLLAELGAERLALREAVATLQARLEEGQPVHRLLRRIGRRLHAHVRRQERELFEWTQGALTEEELAAIAESARRYRQQHRPSALGRGRS